MILSLPPPPPPEIIDREEEWVVEDILDSKLTNQKLRYLVKWKDFVVEHNSWEPRENAHTPDIIADFYWKHPGAARHIRSAEFFSLPFQPTIMPRHHDSERGVDVRGHHSPTPITPVIPATSDSPQYIPPHKQPNLCQLLETQPQSGLCV